MLKSMAPLAALAIAALPAPALGDGSYEGPTGWYSGTTAEGCVVHWHTIAYPSLATFRRLNEFNWSGTPCQKGEPITGEGTLTHRIIDPDSEWNSAGRYHRTGRMVDGVLDGPMRFRSTGPDGPKDWGTDMFRMGCYVDDNGRLDKCTPRKRTAR